MLAHMLIFTLSVFWAASDGAVLDCECDPTYNNRAKIIMGDTVPDGICRDGGTISKCNFDQLSCENTKDGTMYPMCAEIAFKDESTGRNVTFRHCALSDNTKGVVLADEGMIYKCNDMDGCNPMTPGKLRVWNCTTKTFKAVGTDAAGGIYNALNVHTTDAATTTDGSSGEVTTKESQYQLPERKATTSPKNVDGGSADVTQEPQRQVHNKKSGLPVYAIVLMALSGTGLVAGLGVLAYKMKKKQQVTS